jgi:hypothetical protein
MSQVTKTHVESFTILKKQAAAPKNTCNKIAEKKNHVSGLWIKHQALDTRFDDIALYLSAYRQGQFS